MVPCLSSGLRKELGIMGPYRFSLHFDHASHSRNYTPPIVTQTERALGGDAGDKMRFQGKRRR
jgi:hypothetical protein